MLKAIYITHAKRTAIGSMLGSLSGIPAHILGSSVIRSIIAESAIEPIALGEVILGQVITGGAGQNPARQALINANLPQEISAFTVGKVCGSGLKAICLAAQSILADDHEMVIAGGQENMSLGMHAAYIRTGNKFGNLNFIDTMQYDGLIDAFSGKAMGVTAENIANKFNISRQQQDEFAFYSQQKAKSAIEQGYFKKEIVPIEVKIKKQTVLFDQDESVRFDTTIDGLNKLRPAFVSDSGSVTAGNSSTINDGAAACLIVSEEALKRFNLKPIARIVSYGTSGVDPEFMGTAPVPASKLALKKAGWRASDLDVIECNEAFAAQAIYVNQSMGWNLDKVNVAGGAVALGHPIGASGARILVTLLHNMQRLKARKGLATLCIGGGMGIAICIEGC